MKKNKNNTKYISIGFDCEINGMSSDFNNEIINSFIAFKRPILLKTNAVFCNGKKERNKMN